MERDPTPIGIAKFAEAKEGQERSKAAVLAENEHLKHQRDSMQQLLAAILLRFGEDSLHLRRSKELTFEISQLESLSPKVVDLDIVDGKAILYLK